MSEISKKFQRNRWSEVRKQIDAMRPGQIASFTLDKYWSARSSVEHLNDAYDGERPPWQMKVIGGRIVVEHGSEVKTHAHSL